MPSKIQQAGGKKNMPFWIALFPLAYLIILIVLAILRVALKNHISTQILYPFHRMPLSVIWFGVLGGVVISLQGIFFHNADWQNEYIYWYMLSGVIGAIYGVISYLFLLVIVKVASNQSLNANPEVFALAAFTLGYAQKQFNSLIQEVFDVIFRPGNSRHRT